MERVFPENMNFINANDAQNAFGTIDSYIRYMRERVEYSVGVLMKTAAKQAERLEEIAQEVDSLQEDLDGIDQVLSQI